MRVVVCTKETPDTAANITVGDDGVVSWGDAPLVINPWDEYSVEEGLLLKEGRGATGCTVLAVGQEEPAREALKHAIAMGCDEAIIVSDPTLENADTLLTSHALAQALGKIEDVGIALFGKLTTDGGSGQTPVQVGRRLGWDTLTYVSKIVEVDFEAKTITVERQVEEGKQTVTGTLPAVVSVVKVINEPRYPSFMGIRKAAKATIPVWSGADIGLDAGITAQVVWTETYALPPRDGAVELMDGDSVEDKAAALVEKLIGEKVI